jgi:hypothetical protein
MIIHSMRVDTHSAALVSYLATLQPGSLISHGHAVSVIGCLAKQTRSVLASAMKRGVVVREVCEGYVYYGLADGVVVRTNDRGTHLDVWASVESEDDCDLDDPDLIDWMPIKRSHVRAGDLPPPFTLAPASVFHLGGMVQR